MSVPVTPYLIIVPLMALTIWRRVSRQFGRQPVRRKRMMARIGLVALALALLSLGGIRSLTLLLGLLAGAAGGVALGLAGLKLTRFETDARGHDCYVPNSWIGALLTALLIGRLAWRMLVAWPRLQHAQGVDAGNPMASMAAGGYHSSALTMAVIGLLLGYYLCYYTGLLVHHRRFAQQRTDPAVVRGNAAQGAGHE